MSDDDVKIVNFMERALELGKMALDAQEVPIGCVFVVDNTIVAESRNEVNKTKNPTRHAEIICIDTVLQFCKDNDVDYRTYFPRISVYVTVEPCIMCADALNRLKVLEVVYGCTNDRFGGQSVFNVASLYEKSYDVRGNVRADRAMSLLKDFYKGTNPLAPESKHKKKIQ